MREYSHSKIVRHFWQRGLEVFFNEIEKNDPIKIYTFVDKNSSIYAIDDQFVGTNTRL